MRHDPFPSLSSSSSFLSSVSFRCPDEINHATDEITQRMMSRWGEGFALGGLGGLPFSGRTGFTAYSHHVPDEGKVRHGVSNVQLVSASSRLHLLT